MRPLAGSDAAIFDLLQRVIAIGRHRRTWQPADVARVAQHLPGGDIHTRAHKTQRDRADKAEQENARLRQRVRELEEAIEALRQPGEQWQPHRPSHRRVALLTRRQAEVFEQACRGKPHEWIAEDFGLSRTAVSSYISRAAEAIQADSVPHALSLANRGIVEIRIRPKQPGRRKAAA